MWARDCTSCCVCTINQIIAFYTPEVYTAHTILLPFCILLNKYSPFVFVCWVLVLLHGVVSYTQAIFNCYGTSVWRKLCFNGYCNGSM